MHRQRVTDKQIKAALAEVDLTPELCEWHDGAYGRVVFRIDAHLGHYAERNIHPGTDHDGIVHTIEQTAQDLFET